MIATVIFGLAAGTALAVLWDHLHPPGTKRARRGEVPPVPRRALQQLEGPPSDIDGTR